MSILSRREFARQAATFGLATGLGGSLAASERKKKLVAPAAVVPVIASIAGADSLKAHAEGVGLRVGCAVVPELLNLDGAMGAGAIDRYSQAVEEQADILVAENAMKWSSLRPSATTYDFAHADKLFAFAGAFGQAVRGHNLCWHEQLPGWFAGIATKANARELLTEHIRMVAGRYAGRVHSWDVVNEAVNLADGRPDGLRLSPWLELIGPEYLELAFAAAAQADPQAKLTYNDYDIELDTPEQTAKRGQVMMLLRRLHARGAAVQSVGIQSHLQATGPQPGAGLVNFIRELATMGLDVYVTEMDVNTHALDGDAKAQDVAVAEVYRRYLGLVLPELNVKAVLTWGITDAHSWLNSIQKPWTMRADGSRQRPLPLDDAYEATPAFFAMRAAFDGARQQVTPADITQPNGVSGPIPATTGGSGEPFAPFAVPGSPEAPPKP